MRDRSASRSWCSERFLQASSPEPLRLLLSLPAKDPFELYAQLTRWSSPSFLLESGQTHPAISRYSYIGGTPYRTFSAKGDTYNIVTGDRKIEGRGDPFSVFAELVSCSSPSYRSVPELPPLLGGAVGFLSYDLVRHFEQLPELAEDDLDIPDIFFMFVEVVAAIDHAAQMLHLVFAPDPQRWVSESRDDLYHEGRERLLEIEARLTLPAKPIEGKFRQLRVPSIQSQQSRAGYIQRVQECQDLIAAGDIYQANLSHRFHIESPKTLPNDYGMQGAHWYQQVRKINPSPFSALLVLDHCALVCNSPERLVCLEGRCAQIRPIAGTRPRGSTLAEDRQLVEDLLSSQKERAEHLMLVDLARNDLGRVCRYGTIHAEQFMTVERYSHVAHLVSNISGLVRDGVTACDVLRSTFPGGTITGVPKVHCMEIIERLEPVRRGPYTGSIGYVSWSGDMDMNILIRTLLLKSNHGYLQVGAGIVADSHPSHEYDETIHKAEAFFQAFQ